MNDEHRWLRECSRRYEQQQEARHHDRVAVHVLVVLVVGGFILVPLLAIVMR